MCCDEKNASNPEERCCAKIMEMMKNCCSDKEGENADCCAKMKGMMSRNCCPDKGKNQGERPCC